VEFSGDVGLRSAELDIHIMHSISRGFNDRFSAEENIVISLDDVIITSDFDEVFPYTVLLSESALLLAYVKCGEL